MAKRRVHYVLSTHWDREWHESFQSFRYGLVQLVDHILDGLDDGRLAGPFTTDGQAIILEDYLEIRPERQAIVETRARQGTLVIGPWYVLPEEWLVSGEAMVGNLRLGRQIARDFGAEPSSAGFVCDLFGHHSQVPQIFAGFGIRFGITWRGLNTIEHRNLVWRGADGTELPCLRYGPNGYCGYAHGVRHAGDPNHVCTPEQVAADTDAWLAVEAEHSVVDSILMFDGGDHLEWDPVNYAALQQRMAASDETFEIVHSTLDAYGEELLAQRDRIDVVVEGELREPASLPMDIDSQWLIPGVLSSRAELKQANHECQTLLCHWAEPLSALAADALGCEVPDGFLNVAWKWLLRNHPHDFIGGCSVDVVHDDMRFRFSQCRTIAEKLTWAATHRLAASIAGEVADDEVRVVVFNPLPVNFDDTAELTIQVPTDWPMFNEFFGFEPKPGFRIHDAAGGELPYQRLAQAMGQTKKRLRPMGFPQARPTHDVTVSVPLRIPACGYTTLSVRRSEPGRPTRHPSVPGMATGPRSMANEHLSVTVQGNGALTLVDLAHGIAYKDLLTVESVADIGDGWYHGQAVNDEAYLSTASRADVAVIHNGPHLTALRVRTRLMVPAAFDFPTMTREEELVELVVENVIRLRAGAKVLEVSTTIENTAADHRVRLLFPSGASSATTCLMDSQFDVVERPIALRADNHTYRELEVETRPQQSWTAVFEEGRGLAVVAPGLMESAVLDRPDRSVAVTLYRSTRRTVMTKGEPGGLLLGTKLTWDLAIAPLTGAPDRAAITLLGQRVATGLRTAQLRREDQILLHQQSTSLPNEAGYLGIDGPVVVTSARAVDGGLEVRLFNPSCESVEAVVRLDQRAGIAAPTEAVEVDFESNPVGSPQPIGDGRLPITVGAKRIVTLRLTGTM